MRRARLECRGCHRVLPKPSKTIQDIDTLDPRASPGRPGAPSPPSLRSSPSRGFDPNDWFFNIWAQIYNIWHFGPPKVMYCRRFPSWLPPWLLWPPFSFSWPPLWHFRWPCPWICNARASKIDKISPKSRICPWIFQNGPNTAALPQRIGPSTKEGRR